MRSLASRSACTVRPGRRDDVVLDGDRRLRVARLDDADADEALAGQAEAVAQLVADHLGAGAARVGLVADRRRAEAEHAAEPEVDGLAVLPDDAADEGEVAVGVDAAGRHRDGDGVAGGDAGREAARRRRAGWAASSASGSGLIVTVMRPVTDRARRPSG